MDALGRYHWNGGKDGRTDPVAGAHAAVGSFDANAWGLCDMRGNVREWCRDWYAFDYGEGATNPAGPAAGVVRVIRGGGWADGTAECRPADRMIGAPDDCDGCTGFRIVMPAP